MNPGFMMRGGVPPQGAGPSGQPPPSYQMNPAANRMPGNFMGGGQRGGPMGQAPAQGSFMQQQQSMGMQQGTYGRAMQGQGGPGGGGPQNPNQQMSTLNQMRLQVTTKVS